MNCRMPFKAKASKMRTVNGRRQYIRTDAPIVSVGCGRCLWCRIQRRREWTLRLLFESELHKDKWFVTLTYDDMHNPGTISKRELQLFLKRLRKRSEKKIRYYGVGEYGEKTARPHYHCILFGLSEEDLEAYYVPGIKRYQSKVLSDIWTVGMHDLGSVTVESIQYVAGYVHKKLYGKDVYPEGIVAPFSLMSKMIGYKYFVENQSGLVESNGALRLRGKDVNVPRSYIKKMEKEVEKIYGLKNYKSDIDVWDMQVAHSSLKSLERIKSRGLDKFRGRLLEKVGVGHEDDMRYDDYAKLDRLQRQEAEAVDYYLKQFQKMKRKGKGL